MTISPGTLDVDVWKSLLENFGPRLEHAPFGVGVASQNQTHSVSQGLQLLVVLHLTREKDRGPSRRGLRDEIGP